MTDSKIHILPDFIANQIAAGEVVQRPESVVKELVENSLDAGADSVAVIVRGAGKQIIHVVDNGEGMSREDLALATKRHATSKIFSTDDLETIMTFGFRGEALASISSIANVEIRTRRKDDTHGWRLIAEPMKEEIIEPYNSDFGTQIFVKNLFYNVPARRKFLKANLTEFRYISDTMLKIAVSHPNQRFTFYDEDTLIFDVKPSSLLERIENLFGKSTSEGMLPIKQENEYIKVFGYIGQPHLAKQSKAGQFIFLNGRNIYSKSLSHAVFSAYEHLLEKSSNPFYVIFLELDPKNVDVNVHPQKHEVKFEDERFIYGMINKAVSQALQENNLAPELYFTARVSQSPFEKVELPTGEDKSDTFLVNKLTGEIIDNRLPQRQFNNPNQQQSFNFKAPSSPGIFPQKTEKQTPLTPEELSSYEALFGLSSEEKQTTINNTGTAEQLTSGNVYWQLHNKYIFTQTENGLMIIDQHAAHERVLYEKAIKAMNNEFANSQELLFPVDVKVNPSEIAVIKEISEELHELGYDIELNEPDEILIKGVPLDIQNGEEEKSFRSVIEQYEEYQKVRPTSKRDNLAASFSCKAAIKTGQKLSFEEIKKLVYDLFACEVPYACPHGRPIVIEIPLLEFDKRFGRLG